MCTWPTIVDIAEDMELVDGKSLDDVTNGDNKIVGTTCGNDGVDNHTHIGSLVVVRETLMK